LLEENCSSAMFRTAWTGQGQPPSAALQYGRIQNVCFCMQFDISVYLQQNGSPSLRLSKNWLLSSRNSSGAALQE
jgi:hypothetical protein